MIKTIVLYGAIVWAHQILKAYKRFINVQCLAKLCLGHFSRSMPTHGPGVILNYTTLDLLSKDKVALTLYRIKDRNPLGRDSIGNGQKKVTQVPDRLDQYNY